MSSSRKFSSVMAGVVTMVLILGVPLSASAAPAIVATIPVGGATSDIKISPDQSKLYATVGFGKTITVIDAGTNTVSQTLSFPSISGYFWDLAVSPNGNTLYAIDYLASSSSQNHLVKIDLTQSPPVIVQSIDVGKKVESMAMSPDGSKIYAASQQDSTVKVVDVATMTVTATLGPFASSISQNFSNPQDVLVSPIGNYAYVSFAKRLAGSGASGVVKLDTTTNVDVASVTYSTSATDETVQAKYMAISPDGSSLYVANNALNAGWIKKHDVSSNSLNSTPVFTVARQNSALYTSALGVSTANSMFYGNFDSRIYMFSTIDGSTIGYVSGIADTKAIEPSKTSGSGWAYSASNSNNVFEIGVALSPGWQEISTDGTSSINSTAFQPVGFSGTPTYSISGTLPAGLMFNTSTGVISGTATVAQAATLFTVTASDGTYTTTATIKFTSTVAPAPSPDSSSGASGLAKTGNHSQLPVALMGLLFLLVGISVYSGSVAWNRNFQNH